MIHFVLLLFAGFASIFTFSKDILNYASPFFSIGTRMFLAGLVLLAHQWFTNREQFIKIARSIRLKTEKSHLSYFLLLGLINIYLTNIAEIWGVQNMVSSKACLLYSLSPFFAALIAYLVLRETLNLKKWMGMLIGFLGLIPIFFTQTYSEIQAGQIGVFSLAELAILVAVVCSVWGWTILKKIMQLGYSPIFASGVSMFLGGALALGHSYFSGEPWNPIPVSAYKPFLHNTFWMFLISNIVCYNLYGYLLKTYTATFMSFAGLITTFFAALFGWLFLGETITWHYFVSIGFFVVGLSLFYQEEIKRGEAYRVNS
jgi:drug/metabolite transporter (DMT)-like permease